MMMVQLSAPAPSNTEIGPGQKPTAMRTLSLQHSEPLEFGRPEVMVAVSSASAIEQTAPLVYVIRFQFDPPVGK